jgi:hypothetical protein
MADKYYNEYGVFAEKPKVERKLYNGKYIFGGLLVFLLLVIIPVGPNLGKMVSAPKPSLDTPVINKLAAKDKQCVLPTAEMRANHMQLLGDWREDFVRSGAREFTAPNGKKYVASLSNTCMDCHSNKTQFCDKCHDYVAVKPTCWGCHWDKEQKTAARVEAK